MIEHEKIKQMILERKLEKLEKTRKKLENLLTIKNQKNLEKTTWTEFWTEQYFLKKGSMSI